MPPESHNISRKSPGRRRCALAVLIIGVLTTLMCDTVIGQQLPFMQAPYYQAPQRPAMSRGLFYLNAGVKFRNIQEISFKSRDTQLINIAQPGVPAYGPNIDNFVGFPLNTTAATRSAALSPAVSGIWLYTDGFIETTGVIGEAQFAAGGFSGPYSTGDPGLGRFTNGGPGADVGTFMVTHVRKQADDLASGAMQATKHLSFTKILDGITPGTYTFILAQPGSAGTPLATGPAAGTPYQDPTGAGTWAEIPSRGFAAVVGSGMEERSTNKILTPYFEAGMQATNYFDLFLGFGWFDIHENFGRIQPTQVYAARRAYRDFFPFFSDNAANWPADPFFFSGTKDPAAAGVTDPTWVILANGNADSYGNEPYRRFFNVLDPEGPRFLAQETIRSTLDLTAYEFRGGARSWFPLSGSGRIGTAVGFLLAPLQFAVSTEAQYVATAAEATFAVSPGQTLASYYGNHRDLHWAYGAFGGVDMELGGNSYFVKTSAEYNFYFNAPSYGDVVLTTVNVGGFSGSMALGRRF